MPSNSMPSNWAAGCSLIAGGRPTCMGRESIIQSSRRLRFRVTVMIPISRSGWFCNSSKRWRGAGGCCENGARYRAILENGLGLQSREKLVISRLLGMQPINLVHKSKLAKIFIACHLIEPQYKAAFREMRCELDDPAYRHYNRCLTRREIELLKPADETEARAYLLSVVNEATERLRVIEAALEKKAEKNRAWERCLIMHGVSKTGERIRRAQWAFNRLLIQNVNTVQKVQREDDRGWEALRKLREEKRALDGTRTSATCEWSWTPMAMYTMPRATQGMSKPAWNGLNASLAHRRTRAPSSETCSTLCPITPASNRLVTNSRRSVALVEAAGTVRRASPTSIGLMRIAQGVTRWSDENSSRRWPRPRKQKRTPPGAPRPKRSCGTKPRQARSYLTDAVTLIVTGTGHRKMFETKSTGAAGRGLVMRDRGWK